MRVASSDFTINNAVVDEVLTAVEIGVDVQKYCKDLLTIIEPQSNALILESP